MKNIIVQIILLFCVVSTYAQESNNKHLLEAKQIAIVVADDANIKSIDNNKKAVFLIGQTYDYVGLLIKIENTSSNPLVRIRGKNSLIDSYRLQEYSANEYFYYGDQGDYIIEYIDLIENVWVNEFLEAKIANKNSNNHDENDENDENDNSDNGIDDLNKIKDVTYQIVSDITDKQVMTRLLNGYVKDYELSIGKNNNELRNLMLESRRNTLLAEDELNVRIDFSSVDYLISQVDEDKYRLAIEHFISGMKKALNN